MSEVGQPRPPMGDPVVHLGGVDQGRPIGCGGDYRRDLADAGVRQHGEGPSPRIECVEGPDVSGDPGQATVPLGHTAERS